MTELTGRRRPDTPHGDLPPDLQAGDYWKVLSHDGSEPRLVEWPEKLTKDCWMVVVPLGSERGYGIGNLERHTVREEEDGTISVRPNDGSSNSILVSKSSRQSWHGYVEHGVFRTTN